MIEQLRANNAPAAKKNVADFAAALTGAVVTEDTLELVNGTFFLGNSKLGSKLFIRPCYKEMADLILSATRPYFYARLDRARRTSSRRPHRIHGTEAIGDK
eukprot:g15649.t1